MMHVGIMLTGAWSFFSSGKGGPVLALEEGWGEIVMTLFFVFFSTSSTSFFVRTAIQITFEMGVGHSGSALGWLHGVHRLVLQLADGLTDNWYVLETCMWSFQLVGIGFGVWL